MRIIFMGTPGFAVASLKALIDAGQDVVAVVTAPDRPAGRGQKLKESEVKTYAKSLQLPILQPERLKSKEFVEQLRSYQADIQVVVAFRMLPEIVWNMPKHGTLNLHASLLPQYRGAAPINHAIINGERETGVTTFLLQHEIDTGNVLFSEKTEILPAETAGELHDKLMEIGSKLVVKTIQAIQGNKIIPTPQEQLHRDETLHPAPKIFKEDCKIDWNQPSETVFNRIRGLSPYPTAFTELQDKTLKLFQVEKIPFQTTENTPAPGTFHSDGKHFIHIATTDGLINVLQLQLEGKKKMDVVEFLRGYRF